jgi:hypothetical protein
MARTKYSLKFCGYCNKEAKMEMVGEIQEGKEKMWFRCTRCHHMSLIDIQVQANGKMTKLSAENATPYTPQACFKVGEAIFHSEWNDIGKVTNKITTSDGSHAIIVAFEKQGERRLLENLKPEPSAVLENSN